jgi:HEXXH motif-containing protein
MKVTITSDTIKTLVSPTGKNSPLVHALYTRQYQKTLVSLYQLKRVLLSEAPLLADEAGFTSAINILSTFLPSTQQRVLEYPSSAFWIDVAWDLIARKSHILFPEMHTRMHLEEFWRFVLAASLIEEKGSFSCPIWTDNMGIISLPSTGVYLQEPHQLSYQRLKAIMNEGVLSFLTTDGKKEMPVELTQHSVPLTTYGIELNTFDHDLQLPGRTEYNYEQLDPIVTNKWLEVLEEAWILISQSSTLLAEEIPLGLKALVSVRSPSVEIHLSTTFQEAPGLVTMSWTPSVWVIAEALVHEYYHQKLNALTNLDPIIIGPSLDAVYYSPWRDDPRPLAGILHAVYTFQGILEFWNSLLKSGIQLNDEERISHRIYKIRGHVQMGINSLREYAHFTLLGEALLNGIEENYKQQNSYPLKLDEMSKQQIDTKRAEHQARWEEHKFNWTKRTIKEASSTSKGNNPLGAKEKSVVEWLQMPLDFDPSSLLGLRHPQDPLLDAIILAKHNRGLEELSSVLNTAKAGQSLLLDLAGGHVAYILGDYERSAILYEACLSHDSGSPYFWSCFAFALRHLGKWNTSNLILGNLGRLTINVIETPLMLNTNEPVKARLECVASLLGTGTN